MCDQLTELLLSQMANLLGRIDEEMGSNYSDTEKKTPHKVEGRDYGEDEEGGGTI